MVAPCARVDVLVARLGRVEGVVRIVHLRENTLEKKNFWIKKKHIFLPGWREGGLEL